MRRGLTLAAVFLMVFALAFFGSSYYVSRLDYEDEDRQDVNEPEITSENDESKPDIIFAPEARDISLLAAGTTVSDEDVNEFGEEKCFTVNQISDELFDRIYGLSYKKDCTVPRDELRYLRVLHKDAGGVIFVGELIVNRAVAQDVCEIFHELYKAGYPIEKMHLIDDYGADDDASMEDDNTSAFNYRLVAGTSQMSRHAYGMAIDINPFYNPYVIPEQDYVSPTQAYKYGNRDWDFDYKIEKGDLCYRLFIEHGFTWGGEWPSPIDYQHFEKSM